MNSEDVRGPWNMRRAVDRIIRYHERQTGRTWAEVMRSWREAEEQGR